jgi:hypothetical protein
MKDKNWYIPLVLAGGPYIHFFLLASWLVFTSQSLEEKLGNLEKKNPNLKQI